MTEERRKREIGKLFESCHLKILKMNSVKFASAIFIALTIYSFQLFQGVNSHQHDRIDQASSPFSVALDALQQQINYKFKNIGHLRRAMTHASYSEENNKALSILGEKVMETSVSLRALTTNMDISSKDLNRQISDVCNVDPSCASDGMLLRLHKVVRVSPKTSSSTPAIVCGAFRAMFGAIAVDTNSTDVAGSVFWKVHGGHDGRAFEK